MSPAKARSKPEGEFLELRISALEKDGNDTHTKHASIVIDDQKAAEVIAAAIKTAIGIDIATAEDASVSYYPPEE